MKRHLLNVFVIIMFCGLFFPLSAQAIPSLGAIPTSTYEEILLTWSPGDPFEGPFAFTGGSTTNMTVWYGNENNALDKTVHVYIGSTEVGHTFGGNPVTEYATPPPPNQIPSFWHTFGTNYALNLGSIDVPTFGEWDPVTSGPLAEGGGEFWTFTAAWNPGLGAGQWIYSMADEGGGTGVFDNGKDAFSPPTMSTVPEPSTVLLLGGGLIGLALLGRRRFKNRKA